LQSVLADLYWQYFQQNRYSILNRTEVTNQDLPDFKTWDANRFTTEITNLYLASIADAEKLKTTPVDIYGDILISPGGARPYRPTLFDLLGHRAFDYFANDQANITKAADQFTLSNEVAFAETPKFVAHQFANTDKLSVKYYALTVIQQLLELHLSSGNIPALIDADLKRLDFAKATTTLPDKDQRLFNALLQLEKQYLTDTASANVSYRIAQHYNQQADKYEPKKTKSTSLTAEKLSKFAMPPLRATPKVSAQTIAAH
jgi:hypothetical protein